MQRYCLKQHEVQHADPRRLAGSLKVQALLFAGQRYCRPLGFDTWQVLVQATKVDVFGLQSTSSSSSLTAQCCFLVRQVDAHLVAGLPRLSQD